VAEGIAAGDIILYSPAPHDEKGNRLARQYDSPCLCYGVHAGWAYLLRFLDGQYHVIRSWDERWEDVDVDIPPHLEGVIVDLMSTWQEVYGG